MILHAYSLLLSIKYVFMEKRGVGELRWSQAAGKASAYWKSLFALTGDLI